MTYEQAEERLKKLAKGRVCSLKFEKSFYAKCVETDCLVYVEGFSWYRGKTWNIAFAILEGEIHNLVETMGVPKEDV